MGTVTFLFNDIEVWTVRWELDPGEMCEALASVGQQAVESAVAYLAVDPPALA